LRLGNIKVDVLLPTESSEVFLSPEASDDGAHLRGKPCTHTGS